jgi:hypothetical protein
MVIAVIIAGICFGFCMGIALVIPVLTLVTVSAVVGKSAAMIIWLVLAVPLGVLALCALLLFSIYLYGYIGAFRMAYGMYFYGGRYKPLGDLLEPPLPAVTAEA